jgi:putative SOS response-associated peptidase YedK
MCHHYVSAKDPPPWVELVPGFAERVDAWKQIELWPMDQAPVIRESDSGRLELVRLQWGLLPRWWRPSGKRVKRSGFQRKCVNAVSEEIHDKPSYREAFARRRCLMPASEFAESVGRQEFFFHLPQRQTFMIAGIWERWECPEETIETCAMLTTAANAEVLAVGQDRMPVLLTTAEECSAWLEDSSLRGAAKEVMRPSRDGTLESYPGKQEKLLF